MSQRGQSIFVCLLLAAACAWFQALGGNTAQAAALSGEAAIQDIKSRGNYASLAEASRFRAGVRNSPDKQRLNPGQLNQVLLSLREKTGWQSLKFDEEGFLVCPDPQGFSGGSESARRLLGAAIFGQAAYDLEAHNASQVVAFARLTSGAKYESARTGARIETHSLQIDFADFRLLRGEEPALRAFDTGIAVLHELGHGVWKLRDAAFEEEEPGECEIYINRIRRELQLPERQQYQARAHSRLYALHQTRMTAELSFIALRESQGHVRRKLYWLHWDADSVGPITAADLGAKPAVKASLL